jgi:hypothetical protein
MKNPQETLQAVAFIASVWLLVSSSVVVGRRVNDHDPPMLAMCTFITALVLMFFAVYAKLATSA